MVTANPTTLSNRPAMLARSPQRAAQVCNSVTRVLYGRPVVDSQPIVARRVGCLAARFDMRGRCRLTRMSGRRIHVTWGTIGRYPSTGCVPGAHRGTRSWGFPCRAGRCRPDLEPGGAWAGRLAWMAGMRLSRAYSYAGTMGLAWIGPAQRALASISPRQTQG